MDEVSNSLTVPPGTGGRRKGGSARTDMKRKLALLILLAALLALGLIVSASAAIEDNLTISMQLSKKEFSEPGPVTVSITITNAGESDMPGPVTLWDPNGKQVEDFGAPVLEVGASKSWSGKWNVTQAQLDAGRIGYAIRYSIYVEDEQTGESTLMNKRKGFSLGIKYTGATTEAKIDRVITPTMAGEGQEVSVTYTIANTGNTEITDVTIKENSSISRSSGTIASIPAGETGSYTFTVNMGKKDLTSQATVTYKSQKKTFKEQVEAATVKYGEVKLSASLKADKKGGTIGDPLTLTLTLKNTGNIGFSHVSVTDTTLGELFTEQSVPAGETVTLTKETTINAATSTYRFVVSGEDEGGSKVETATDRVTVKGVDESQRVMLNLTAFADRETVYELPGTVKFTVQVTNESSVDVTDVNVYATGVQLYNFPSILAGETREFTRDINVSMAGQYQFEARVLNALEETQSFLSNIIRVDYAEPTAVPTSVPIVTPPAPVYEDEPTLQPPTALEEALPTVQSIAMVLAGVGLILLLIAAAARLARKARSSKAQDVMERGSVRDYTQPGKDAGKQAPAAPKAEEPAAESTDDSEAAAEAVEALYADKPAEQSAEADTEVHRRRRRQSEDDKA